MTNAAIDALGTQAANMVMQGAVDVLRQRGLTTSDIDADALCSMLRERAKVAIHEALGEAREAFEANMGQVGVATFNASMRLAGVRATSDFLTTRA